MRLTATITKDKNPGSLTASITIDLPENTGDVGARVSGLLNEVAAALDAATAKPLLSITNAMPTNGHGTTAKPQTTAAPASNGNGHSQEASPKQVAYIGALRAKAGMRMTDLAARIVAEFGPGVTLKSLSKDQASQLIESMKSEHQPLKGE